MALEKVLVLLVNYNTTELIPEVLDSIKEDKVDVSVLIVDNGSTMAAYEGLKQIKDPRVTIIRTDVNLGIGGGNNLGLEYAIEHFADINLVFLLNTDAYCSPDVLYNLKEILVAHPDAASVTPYITMRDGSPWYGGSMINYKSGVVSQFIDIPPGDKREVYEVDVFNGCAVLFDFKKMQQAGLLNDKLFMYYEEADLSMRLHKLGYKNLYAPRFTVVHDVSYTTRKVSFVKTYYMTRNKFVLFNDKMSLGSKMYFLGHELAYHIKHKRFKNAFYHMKGYLDFRKGRSGKLQLAGS